MAMAVHRGGFISPLGENGGGPFLGEGRKRIALSTEKRKTRTNRERERERVFRLWWGGEGREGEGSPKATIPYVVVVVFVVVVARSQSSGRHVPLWTREEKNARYKLALKFARVYVVLYNFAKTTTATRIRQLREIRNKQVTRIFCIKSFITL